MRIGFWIFCQILGISGLTLILWRFSPQTGGAWGIPAVYTSIFLFVYGAASQVGYSMRRWLWKKQALNEMIRTAGRQGFLLALMCVVVLVLLAANLFNLWTATLLMIIFLFLELYGR
ncbi:MAG: hypothetical protein A2846_00145 [Candidatus Doudnabacteria bacterium RIFCSPHIGHO2_01_FULL_49_9]|uniref:Uncharacterized protein n=1 Tax=Candidatus Doudnabacteria bacterium RIFCSPHIGHO2_01_FULL_49_9 TaxID=1817827 RepID=A0A1F5P214_9BACT|nr:MAG: hypothetical protein A2846_00145 [Candidatus Doudnabacteria bacterium RIFCSPHIGHO2_01_FULL_49_9]